MSYFWLVLLLVGLVILVVGYRRNNRNILLGAALLMLASVAVPEMVEGFQEGYSDARHGTSAG